MDKWAVWFYVKPFTLHLNRDRTTLIVPIVLVQVPFPVPEPDTAEVITLSEPLRMLKLSGYHADTPITIKAEASSKADSRPN